MGNFGKSLSRELGKNTGKWISNKVFGDGHATPHKLIHARERENARLEREEARRYREQQKQIERERREQAKRLAQLEKEEAEREKQQMIANNLQEIEEHNNYINIIQSVHKDYSKAINWDDIIESEEPEYVKTSNELKDDIIKYTNDYIDQEIELAKENSKSTVISSFLGELEEYQHSWLLKMAYRKYIFSILQIFYFFKKGFKSFNRKKELTEDIESIENQRQELINENLLAQDSLHEQYLKAKSDWKDMIQIAKGVKNKDSQCYTYAINFFNPFEDLKEYGSDISFSVKPDIIIVDFFVHSEEVIPNTIKKALRKGIEVKEDPMTPSKFNEIYQDYVCSCILRIAKEIFQLLPVMHNVLINAKGMLLNSANGNYEEKTIVSVKINREKLSELNFDLLDPSDSMINFEHNMDFKKAEGFNVVEELKY